MQDDDPLVGPLETSLYRLGSGYLQRVHRDVHRALGLPSVRLASLQDAYPSVRIAKAAGEDGDRLLTRAYATLRDILAKRGERQAALGEGVPPEDYDRLIDATTDKWLAEGHLKTRSEKHAVALYIAGLMPADGLGRSVERLWSEYTPERGSRRGSAVEYARARAAAHVTRLDQNTRHQMRTLLYAWEQTNQQVMTLEPMLRAAFGRLNRDWRRVAITEAAFNRANGRLAALALGTLVEWSAAADACPKCRNLHGRSFKLVDANDPDKDPQEHVWVGKNPVGSKPPEAMPSIPLHPHCLPGDAHVLARGVSGHTERWYEGPVVRIGTRSGNHLTCTPNHPVLTPRGWVAAGGLHVGDHVISGRAGDRMLHRLLHDEHVEGRIEQVIHARRESPQVTTRPVPVAPEHFHGDGRGSQVAHVGTNHELWDAHDAALQQEIVQATLVLAVEAALAGARVRSRDLRALGIGRVAARLVGGRHLARALRRAHASPLHALGLAAPAPWDARVVEAHVDDVAADAVAGRETVDALAGHVTPDEVTVVERDAFRGHVYNLHTRDGWYVANGIVTHNCRCSWRTLLPLVQATDDAVRLAAAELRKRALQP